MDNLFSDLAPQKKTNLFADLKPDNEVNLFADIVPAVTKQTPIQEEDYTISTGPTATVKMPVSGALEVKDYSPAGAIWKSLKEPAKQSREGFGMIEKSLFNPARETTGDISTIKELPRTLAKTAFGVVSEFSASSIEPETLITIGLLKGTGVLAKTAAGKEMLSKVSDVISPAIKKLFITRYGQPAGYQDLALLRKIEIAKGKETALNIGQKLTKGLSRAEQQRAGQILKGSITTAKTAPAIVDAAAAARAELQNVGQQAVQQGLLDKFTFLKNLKTYSPRLYRVFEKPNIKFPGTGKSQLQILSEMTPEQLSAMESLSPEAAQKVIDYARNTRSASLYSGTKPVRIKGEAFKHRVLFDNPALKDIHIENIQNKIEALNIDNMQSLGPIDKIRLKNAGITTIEKLGDSSDSVINKILQKKTIAEATSEIKAIIETINKPKEWDSALSPLVAEAKKHRSAKKFIDSLKSMQNYIRTQEPKLRAPKPITNELQLTEFFNQVKKKPTPQMFKIAEEPTMSVKGKIESITGIKQTPIEEAKQMLNIKNIHTKDLYHQNEILKYAPEQIGITEKYRQALGEIKEPGMPIAKRLFQTKRDVETAKLFNSVAANPAWSSVAESPDMVQMPVSKGLGNLSGKFVNKYIADDINEITKISTQAEKMWNKTMGLWKAGKVLWNPSTHARNTISNSMLLDLSGVDQSQQLRLLPQAGKELLSKGKYYVEAKQAGLWGKEYSTQEIGNILNSWEGFKQPNVWMRILEMPRYMNQKLGKIYQAEEQWFKMAKFIAEREKGSSIKEAASQANKWLFDYSEVPKFIDWLRRSPVGTPFVTFTYKALPRVAEALINNPTKVYKYKLLFDAIEKQGAKGEEEQYAAEKAALPKYMKGSMITSKNLRLPFKDKYQRSLYLDLTYILPWGDIAESGGMMGIPGSLTPGGLIKPIIESAVNYSLFKKGTIFNESDLPTEKYGKIMDYLYKAYMPSLAPEVPGIGIKGGYSYQKLKGAIQGTPDWMDRTNTVLSAMASTLAGLKTIPIDLGEEQGRRVNDAKRQIQEVKQAFGRISKNPATTPQEQLKAEKNFELKINSIMEKLSEQIQ